jgi:hypothetical protein
VPPDVPPPPVLGAPLGTIVGDILGTGATVEAGGVATAGVVVLGTGAGGALASAEVLGAGAGGALPTAGALGLAEHVQDGVGALGCCEGLAEHPQALATWAVTLADAGTVVKVLQAAKLIAATPRPVPAPATAVLIFISGLLTYAVGMLPLPGPSPRKPRSPQSSSNSSIHRIAEPGAGQ